MSYSYRMESRLFFLILSVLLSTFIFSILYFFQVFGEKLNSLVPLIISLFILAVLFFIGLTSLKMTVYFYSFIYTSNDLKKMITKIDIDESEENIEKMIKRFKEVFFNLNLSEKKKSISMIRRTVGFSEESALQVYLILKNINFTKSILVISGLLISVIIYFILVKINFFMMIKDTVFLPIAISLIIFLIFVFESVLISKLPTHFYLNLVSINKRKLTENKKDITDKEDNLSNIFKEREEVRENLKKTVSNLISKGLKKQDVLDILASKQDNIYGLKDLIMQAPEIYDKDSSKLSYQEVADKIKTILEFHNDIKKKDSEILKIKEKIDEIKKVQETIEKINSKEWNYYRHTQFKMPMSKKEEKNITDDIVNKIHYRQELKEDSKKLIDSLYNSFLPYVETINKDQIYSILISKGYSYETVLDLIEKFKQNKIDLSKNKKSIQDKVVSKINNLYDNFKD